METLLLTLVAFIGTMLVFALAAQSVQEILKTMLVVRGRTLLTAINGLVREAARLNSQWSIDAEAILTKVTERLAALGQNGVRPRRIRLDALTPAQLEDLISKVEPADVPGLPGDIDKARAVLANIGRQAREWFPIAVAPVDDRYRRRMRVLALVSAALVVIPFNLDAFRVYHLARNSAEFRAGVDSLLARMDTVYRAINPEPAADSARATALAVATDTAARVLTGFSREDWGAVRRLYSKDLLGTPSVADTRRGRWWLGILLSIALVSLGAPFWHDLLESLFGLKQRLNLKAPVQDNGTAR